MSIVIETTIGDITVDLFTDERPLACLNFVKLCKLKYYNYNLFHTIEQGFIAQTGDPTGAGDGGSSIWGVVEGHHKRFFEAETLPKIHHTTVGLLSLVGAGKHLVGSQFFFTLGENLTSLDGQHSVIGEVVEGHNVLRQLNEAIVDDNFRPYQDIRITHTIILEDPFLDPRGFNQPSRSPSPNIERLKNGRIAADEDIDDAEGKSMEEIQEMLAQREAKARATILEIVGDLPDADMAPPENVLFVCKLNPVTTDDDLEIIFSRFGKVKGCEVIRDRKTGDSLQYAFVEFEDQKACEAAYFKMDNVLIDDRRIHVDFSQSVSKVQWKGKGRGIEGDSMGLDFDNLRVTGKKPNNATSREYEKKQNSIAREKRNRDDRHKRLSRSHSSGVEPKVSTKRYISRQERHREFENYKRRSRDISSDRNDKRQNKSHYNTSKNDKLKSKPRSSDITVDRSDIRENNSIYYRLKYRERTDNYSTEKKRNDKYVPIRNYDRYKSESVKSKYSERCQDRKAESRKTANNSPKYKNATEVRKKRKKEHRKRSKKSKHDSSSSSEESSSESSTSESSESTSTESKTSETERIYKKRKNKCTVKK